MHLGYPQYSNNVLESWTATDSATLPETTLDLDLVKRPATNMQQILAAASFGKTTRAPDASFIVEQDTLYSQATR